MPNPDNSSVSWWFHYSVKAALLIFTAPLSEECLAYLTPLDQYGVREQRLSRATINSLMSTSGLSFSEANISCLPMEQKET